MTRTGTFRLQVWEEGGEGGQDGKPAQSEFGVWTPGIPDVAMLRMTRAGIRCRSSASAYTADGGFFFSSVETFGASGLFSALQLPVATTTTRDQYQTS